MFVALGIQHVMRMPLIVICGLSCSTAFVHIISQTARFKKKKNRFIIQNAFFNFLYNSFQKKFLILRRTGRDMMENVYWSSCKAPVILFGFYRNKFSRQIFEKYANVKFQENLCGGSWSVPRRQREGQTNMTKLMSLFEILRTRLKTRIPHTFRSPVSFEKLICAERKLMKWISHEVHRNITSALLNFVPAFIFVSCLSQQM